MTAALRTRAAIYLRQSLDATGEQLAVRRQRDDCRRIAEHRGWNIVAEYTDNSVSASDARKARPGYDQLVAEYAEGGFDALVCWDLDRLTRQPRQLEDWIDAAAERGLLLITANGEADLSTDGGRMFARIKASVARAEIERKSARQRRAAQQRAEQGRPPLGPRLTGYTSSGATVPDEAAIVEKVFDRFASGDSLRSLAAWLTSKKVPTRSGRPWNPSSVRTMLINPRYAGRAVYDGRQTGQLGGWEPIITEDVFLTVAARLDDPRRKTNRQGTDRKHLGSSLYECGVCSTEEGSAPVKVRAWSGNRYRCPNACVNRTGTGVDEYVVAVVREWLTRHDLADLLAPAAASDEQRALRAEIKKHRDRLAVIESDYDSGLIDGRRYKVATEKTGAELAAAEIRLARLGSPAAAALLRAKDPVAAFNGAPLMLRRGIIEALCTVRLLPAPRGRRTFDPDTVMIDWKGNR